MKNKTKRIIAVFFLISILFDVVFPTTALALTSGPSQPEVEAFTPISTSDMVNVSTGDFNYNIPLLDIDGYPVNLAYDAGIGTDQEASWVGLGWNINPGTVNRNMRGLPDDFKGDVVHKEMSMKANQTFGFTAAKGFELFGISKVKKGKSLQLKLSVGLNYNTYNGYGIDIGGKFELSASKANRNKSTGSLGLTSGSGKGLGITADYSFSKKADEAACHQKAYSRGIGLNFNTLQGLTDLTLKASKQTSKEEVDTKGNVTVSKTDNNGGSSLSFLNTTYMPKSDVEMVNVGLSLSVSFGGEAVGAHPKGIIGGYYSGQFVKDKTKDYRAYGYLNSQKANSGEEHDILHDFNREKDQSFTLNTPNLPVTNYSYDVFNYTGQGIGGNFRPHRNDIGTVFDPYVKNFPDLNTNIGLEIGGGNVAHGGVNVALMVSRTRTGKWAESGWSELNNSEDETEFKENGFGFDEMVYFKQAGEKTAENNQNYFDNVFRGFDPVRFQLQKVGPDASCTNNLVTKYGASSSLSNNVRTKRKPRNESLNILNADQASFFGIQTDLKNYGINSTSMFYGGAISSISRTSGSRQGYHMSEISTLRSDGARYVYGLPMYNNIEKQVSFAVEPSYPSGIDFSKNEVQYSASSENSTNNNSALDHFYHSEVMPGYAHSFLLTSVLSADYVDKTQDGPTRDDLGSYTRFNYTRVHSDFEWRTPYSYYGNKANYSEGLRSIYGPRGDDKANYVYGKKEIWYTHSIETKNHVAVFILSDRLDGHGVAGENGGFSSSAVLKKLDEIRLYTRQELADKQGNAVPYKVVHFEYDYSLCKGVENNVNYPSFVPGSGSNTNSMGKLTLKKVWFTYESSLKGKLSPYEFIYADNNHDLVEESNFDYNSKSYDRWGNYKPNIVSGGYSPNNVTNVPLTAEFPYVQQSADGNGKTADDYSAAWNLSTIKLPSGGKIDITYEADDYAFVQDKKAMQMFTVAGTDINFNGTPNNILYDVGTGNYNHVYIPLNSQVIAEYVKRGGSSQIQKDKAVRDMFFRDQNGKDIEYLYFRFLVNVERDISAYTPKYEYISGYARINFNFTPYVNANNQLVFTLKDEPVFDNIPLSGVTINPISMAGINFIRKNMPQVANDNNQDPTTAGNMLAVLNGLKSVFTPLVQFFKGGVSNALRLSGASKKYIPARSFVRLYSPTQIKKGGGYRVKQLTLSDEWRDISQSANNSTVKYGQEYFYTAKDGSANTISSGVATYEPMIGGDENPFRRPVFYSEKHILAPDDDYYHEEPYGESMFPGPSVGYSRVVVRNLVREKIVGSSTYKVKRHGTGAVVHEFYTAKDFPTLTDRTDLKKERHKPNPVAKFLKFFVKDYMTTSQGFLIVLNDMHGKPKAQWVYKEPDASLSSGSALEEYYGNNYISGIEYKYKTNGNRLSNTVSVINKDGSVNDAMLGVDYDMVVDTKESKTVTRNVSTNGNLEGFLLSIFPAAVPSIFPGYNQEKVRYRSSVVTKVIFQTGILEQTIAYDNSSSVATKNKLWDPETGEVLLTETTNNFKDNIYSFKQPSYWAYDRMGGAYKNSGAVSQISAGNVVNFQIFVPGDEVILKNSSGADTKAWVSKLTPSVEFISSSGSVVNLAPYVSATIIRSGYRNQQSIPAAALGSLVNPVVNNNLQVNSGTKVISATASEFKDTWGIFCNCGVNSLSTPNPYLTGQSGNWRTYASYSYLTGREQSLQNNNTNLRKDGPYTTFNPFWVPNSFNNWLKSNDPAWQYTSKSTIYHPAGAELENIDALNRSSSAIYGYGNALPVAVSSNAMYKQIAFDGFEDYDYNDPCDDNHFSYMKFNNGSANVTYNKSTNNYISKPSSQNQKYAHTGRKAIKLAPGASSSVGTTLTPTPPVCTVGVIVHY